MPERIPAKNHEGVKYNTSERRTDDPRFVYRDEKKIRAPIGLIILALFVAMILFVMSIASIGQRSSAGASPPASGKQQSQNSH